MWWKKNYINRRDWILENVGLLSINPNEFLVLCIIDYLNTHRLDITLEELSQRTGLPIQDIDVCFESLSSKKYLEMKIEDSKVIFSIDGLFQEKLEYEYVDRSVFEIFESEFGRLLSQGELETLNVWLRKYSQEDVIDALRMAVIYKKVTMQYINGVLVNKQKERPY